jgi:hypothetical protein
MGQYFSLRDSSMPAQPRYQELPYLADHVGMEGGVINANPWSPVTLILKQMLESGIWPRRVASPFKGVIVKRLGFLFMNLLDQLGARQIFIRASSTS